MTGATSEGEWLAYSAGWLAFAGLLLAQGIRRGDRMLRAAALVVAGVAVLKAFLFDLGELEGLYRAASFLGLGPLPHRHRLALPPLRGRAAGQGRALSGSLCRRPEEVAAGLVPRARPRYAWPDAASPLYV